MKKEISLIMPAQGNLLAMRKTFDSFKNVVDEIIVGDVCVFKDDKRRLESYKNNYNLKVIGLPFNEIFLHGFANTLNILAGQATNNWILYMNVSEVVDGEENILAQMQGDYNSYYFDHASDEHLWARLYNKKELYWSGMIHEQITGELNTFPTPIFRMKDLEKDNNDPFKAKVYNDIKEIVYFNQYLKLVDQLHLLDNTNYGWVQFAREGYHSFIERLHKKGKRYEAFITGDYDMYMDDIYNNPEFEEERFESSKVLEFQGDKKYLL